MAHSTSVYELDVLSGEPQVEECSQRRSALGQAEAVRVPHPVEGLVALAVHDIQRARAPLEDREQAVSEEPADDAVFAEVVEVPAWGRRGRGRGLAVPDPDRQRGDLDRVDSQVSEC